MTTTTVDVIPEFSAQSKFQKIPGPLQQLPHKCAACYRYDNPDPDREGHLDFVTWNQDIEYYGVVFVCTDCLREIVNQLGWATEDQVKKAQEWILSLQAEVHKLTMENVNLRNAVGNLSLVRSDLGDFGPNLVAPVEASVEASGDSAGDANEPADEPKELGAADEESAGSADEQGSTDLRDDDDLSKLLDEI